MENNKDQRAFQFINLTFDNSQPPKFVEKKDLDWIIFGNETPYINNYPTYILNLYKRANKHRAMLNAKAYYVAGNGVSINKEGLTVADYAQFLELVKNSNQYGEDIEELVQKIALDFEIFEGAYLEVNWTRNGKKFEVTHIPFHKLRIDKDKKSYWYSNDWTKPKNKQSKEETGLENIPVFDPNNRTSKQIYALKGYNPALEFYPEPNYLAVIPVAETEAEIANYHLKSIKSGFNIGTVITFIGNPSDDEKDEIERQLKEKFAGSDNAGSLLLMFTRDKDNAPVITRLSPDELDKKFETLNDHIEQELVVAHHLSPMLAGFKTEGQLGGRSEIDTAHELFKNTYVKARQKQIEKYINTLYSFIGFDNRIKLNDCRPVNPFDFKDIMQYMDKNEIREMAGLPPVKSIMTSQTFGKSLTSEDILNFVAEELQKVGESKEAFHKIDSARIDNDGFYSFAKDQTGKEKDILAVIKKDNKIDPKSISDLLGIEEKTVIKTISNLVDDGYLKEYKDYLKPTADGKELASESKIDEYEIRYSYELDPEATHQGKEILETSHEFCKKMFSGAKKYFLRSEIDTLSNRLGYNVWEMRGGWQTIKGNTHIPHCRHIWEAHKVKRK